MRSPPPIRIEMEPLTQNWRIFFPLFSFYSSSSSTSFTIIIALEGEWRKEGRKNKKKKGGKRKIAPLWVHSLLDGFMNSARSHLKDYIREGSRNERGRRERSFSIATAPIPAILYDIVHPRPSLLSPHNLEEEKEEEERGNFELLFDDDASPARAVALFYRRLRDRDIDWDSRNSAKGPPYKSLKRDLCRRGERRGVRRVGYSNNVPSGWSTIADLYESGQRCSIKDKKEESLVWGGREGTRWYLVHKFEVYYAKAWISRCRD